MSVGNPSILADVSLEIALGNLQGISGEDIFGENPSIAADATEDLWDDGGTYSYPTTADITHLSQAADQVAMRGKTIQISGLDVNWDLITQTKALDGTDTTTSIALDTALRRVFSLEVLANVVADQVINLKNVGGGTTYAAMQIGLNHTLMAQFTVPNAMIACMTSYYADVISVVNKDPLSTEFKLFSADRQNTREFVLRHEKGVALQTPSFQHFFNPYLEFTQKTDIKMTGNPKGKEAHVHGGFGLVLVDV